MPNLASTVAGLASLQNADGGWPYHPEGGSWTEPTAYAVLAQSVVPWAGRDASVRKAVGWLLANQRPDGGWPPHSQVTQSTWVTALVLICLGSGTPEPVLRKAIDWIVQSSGRETGFLQRLRALLHGGNVAPSFDGWPWFPGSAAWVEPTALTIIGLRRAHRKARSAVVAGRIESGVQYLLNRRCRDQGWNHGSTRALGYDSDSYPESTGLALLALCGAGRQKLERSIQTAVRLLEASPAGEARSWLELGLLAQGIPGIPPSTVTPRNSRTREIALWLLAAASREGRDAFA